LQDVSPGLSPGLVTLVLGSSGSGKWTLLRAFAGLVPHFHGGGFSGRVEVAGVDTRRHGPARLAGTVATLFQDPEDQVVFTRVLNEVAFGLENVGTPAQEIEARALDALAWVGAEHLAGRLVTELSGGELQRVCLAATLALEPKLLLFDEPTSQLDPEAAESLVELALRLARDRGTAVLLSEQRPALPLEVCDRVLFLDRGRLAFDEPVGGHVEIRGRATYLSQDPGRYVFHERADEEVAVGVDGDLAAASRALAAVGLSGYEDRHPRDLSSGERERLALAAVLAPERD